MSRIAHPSEKIIAVVGVYKALWTELFIDPLAEVDVRMQVQLMETATRIAMGTDTRDMGIMSPAEKAAFDMAGVCDDCGMPSGAHDYEVEH